MIAAARRPWIPHVVEVGLLLLARRVQTPDGGDDSKRILGLIGSRDPAEFSEQHCRAMIHEMEIRENGAKKTAGSEKNNDRWSWVSATRLVFPEKTIRRLWKR